MLEQKVEHASAHRYAVNQLPSYQRSYTRSGQEHHHVGKRARKQNLPGACCRRPPKVEHALLFLFHDEYTHGLRNVSQPQRYPADQ